MHSMKGVFKEVKRKKLSSIFRCSRLKLTFHYAEAQCFMALFEFYMIEKKYLHELILRLILR
jgi:hypothetical protein